MDFESCVKCANIDRRDFSEIFDYNEFEGLMLSICHKFKQALGKWLSCKPYITDTIIQFEIFCNEFWYVLHERYDCDPLCDAVLYIYNHVRSEITKQLIKDFESRRFR